MIHRTTNRTIGRAVAMALERGYSIEQLARGVPDDQFPGLRSILTETEKRARLIARTEIMRTQNQTSVGFYKEQGFAYVRADDVDGDPDDNYIDPGDPYGRTCIERHGQIYTVEDAGNIDDHPNGTLELATDAPELQAGGDRMINKFALSEVKVLDDRQGIIEAYTNTMGIKDSDGDIIDPAAFNSSIKANLPIPVLAGHDQSKLVGKVLFAQSEPTGAGDEHRLYTRMQMNLDTQVGQEAYSNIAGEFIREWSVGFNLPAGDAVVYDRAGKETVRRILDLDWVEVSAVIRGASPSTSTIAAKNLKAPNTYCNQGRSRSQSDRTWMLWFSFDDGGR
jgi:HK97 family phage prohead protease